MSSTFTHVRLQHYLDSERVVAIPIPINRDHCLVTSHVLRQLGVNPDAAASVYRHTKNGLQDFKFSSVKKGVCLRAPLGKLYSVGGHAYSPPSDTESSKETGEFPNEPVKEDGDDVKDNSSKTNAGFGNNATSKPVNVTAGTHAPTSHKSFT
jgi:hypothetical protein